MNRRNITTSLFQREIGSHQNSISYWKLRLEEDFGSNVASQGIQSDCRLVYQNHYRYYEFLKSAIIKLESIRPQDIIQFLKDNNIGNGRVQEELLKILLSKPGAYEACCYLDSFDSSALSHAAIQPNKKCFMLIKDKLLVEDESLLRQLLIKKDISGKSPLDYFRQEESINSANDAGTHGGEDLFVAVQGGFNSLVSVINSLGDRAKTVCMQSRDSYDRTILHAIAESGSMKCLTLIMVTLGKDIEKLYIADLREMTPACYAASYGSLEFLRAILRLSPSSPEAELINSSGKPSELVDRVMTSNDLGKLQLILAIMKQDMDKMESWYTNNPNGVSLILNHLNFSAANFFVLKEHMSVDRDCKLIQEFTNNNSNIPFSLYCAMNCHLLELEVLQRKTL